MIALDTNILVRLLTQDDPLQFDRVRKLLGKPQPFFVGDLVFAELVWVLESVYEWKRDRIATALFRLLSKTDLVVEDEERLMDATKAYEEGGDFADHLICLTARKKGCQALATFDKPLRRMYRDFAVEP